jgi:hypothetical protein
LQSFCYEQNNPRFLQCFYEQNNPKFLQCLKINKISILKTLLSIFDIALEILLKQFIFFFFLS